jgi:hypothetical protein
MALYWKQLIELSSVSMGYATAIYEYCFTPKPPTQSSNIDKPLPLPVV